MARDIHKFPSELAERFQVRMPDGLRDKLREAAEVNNRSMNSEIVARLEASFAASGNALSAANLPADMLNRLLERMDEMESRLTKTVGK